MKPARRPTMVFGNAACLVCSGLLNHHKVTATPFFVPEYHRQRPLASAINRGGSRRRNIHSFARFRGGATPSEEDTKLDAYIESLISSVEDSIEEESPEEASAALPVDGGESDDKDKDDPSTDKNDEEQNLTQEENDEEKSDVAEEDDDDIGVTDPVLEKEGDETQSGVEEDGKTPVDGEEPKSDEEKSDVVEEDGDDDNKVTDPVVEKESNEAQSVVEEDAKLPADDEERKIDEEKSDVVEGDNDDHNDNEVTDPVVEKESDEAQSGVGEDRKTRDKDERSSESVSSTESSGEQRRPLPPNALYRFLLHRGRIGHVVVMTLVVVVEWICTYVPLLARFLSWLWSLVFPSGRFGFGAPPSERITKPTKQSPVNLNARGRSAKERKAIAKKADQAALEALKRAGSVQQAKYRHVTLDFMKRHGLGEFAKGHDSAIATVGEDSTAKGFRNREDDDEEEDTDWVVQALTEKKSTRRGSKSRRSSSAGPSVSVQLGSSGGRPSIGLGLELNLGTRRQKIVEATTSSRTKTKKRRRRTVQRASDSEGGDGIMGRLRSAAGANSLVSRSLLGAYPRDALPPSEAASSDGLVAIARKYGYGDLDEEDNDDENELDDTEKENEDDPNGQPTRTKRRKKRKKKTVSSPRSRRKRSSSSSSSRPRTRKRKDNVIKVQPALERIRRVKRRTKKSKQSEEAATVLPGLELKREVQQSAKTKEREEEEVTRVRPAMERIREIQQKAANKNDQ